MTTSTSIFVQIQSEFCNGQTVADEIVLRQRRGITGFSSNEMVQLISHCAKGLSFIHDQQLGKWFKTIFSLK